MNSNYRIGIDVGGSHFSASVIPYNAPTISIQSATTQGIDSKQSASAFVRSFTQFINHTIQDDCTPQSIGIAFPGPFNYAEGICGIHGVGGKFSNLFGLHLKASIQNKLKNQPAIYFANDAHCFALGCHQHLQLKNENAIFITLGTGFGSAFMLNGHLIHEDASIPEGGAFYYLPFANGIADEYFSTRWFIQAAKTISGKSFESVKEIVINHPDLAATLFNQFCNNFTAFMLPWLKKFNCKKLIIGGNIAKSNVLFIDQLNQTLLNNNLPTEVVFINETENMIMMGAACMADEESYAANFPAQQIADALIHTFATNVPPVLPGNKIEGMGIEQGIVALAKQLSTHSTIKIDGVGGTQWEVFRKNMQVALEACHIETYWYSIGACLKEATLLKELSVHALNAEDSGAAQKYLAALHNFFDADKIKALQPDKEFALSIIYGTGSALAHIDAPIVYLNIPTNEIYTSLKIE